MLADGFVVIQQEWVMEIGPPPSAGLLSFWLPKS